MNPKFFVAFILTITFTGDVRADSHSTLIPLFSDVNFVGAEITLNLSPGCNDVPDDWNDLTGSIGLKFQDQCVILFEDYGCGGHSARITHLNAKELNDLSNVGLGGMLSALKPCNSGKCDKVGFFIDPGNCHNFFRCIDNTQTGQNFQRNDFACPEGQVFDEKNTTCNLPDRIHPPVVCSNQ